MKKNLHHKMSLLFFLVFTSIHIEAQTQFEYKAPVNEIKKTGFYKITLLPEIVAKCNENLSDLRITDAHGNIVPYALRSDLPFFSTNTFLSFPVLFNEKKDSSSEIIIANKPGGSINSLLLGFKNFSAYRTAALSGSDDKQKWFIIKENILLEDANSNTSNERLQSISFPLSNYKFFKVIINDKGLLPVNFIKAGIYTNSFTYGKYLTVPNPVIKQKDSNNKHSYISICFNDNYEINRLNIKVKGPPLYKRSAVVYENAKSIREQLSDVEITPVVNVFSIPAAKTNNLLIDIFNKDDQPVLIEQVEAFQINQYLLTRLEANENYNLYAGCSAAIAPDYDLKYFADSIDNNVDEVGLGKIEKNTTPAKNIPAYKK
jgi:hypothetical protein